jgi:hypothetical protein
MSNGEINPGEFQDFMMAQSLAARAFMLSISVELARLQTDPETWARAFVSTLHARIDVHERSLGPIALRTSMHEMARKEFDVLGQRLFDALRLE